MKIQIKVKKKNVLTDSLYVLFVVFYLIALLVSMASKILPLSSSSTMIRSTTT